MHLVIANIYIPFNKRKAERKIFLHVSACGLFEYKIRFGISF